MPISCGSCSFSTARNNAALLQPTLLITLPIKIHFKKVLLYGKQICCQRNWNVLCCAKILAVIQLFYSSGTLQVGSEDASPVDSPCHFSNNVNLLHVISPLKAVVIFSRKLFTVPRLPFTYIFWCSFEFLLVLLNDQYCLVLPPNSLRHPI